jgi:hypothetical protein
VSRAWLIRAGRIALVGALAWLAYYVLSYFGISWVLWVLLGLGVTAFVVESLLRRSRRRKREEAWARWEAATVDDEARPAAIAEIRERLKASRRLGTRTRLEQAHLSVMLAELLDASGVPAEGARVLAQVPVDELDAAQAAVVRHAKVVCYLSAGDLEGADLALSVRDDETSATDVDARLDLLGLFLAIEKGDPERALREAAAVAKKAGDEEVELEAKVVEAAALDALGRREEALTKLRTIDEPTLRGLERLGAPRVRPLAAAAITEASR